MNVSMRQAISAPKAHHSHACTTCDNSVIRYIRISAGIVIVSVVEYVSSLTRRLDAVL